MPALCLCFKVCASWLVTGMRDQNILAPQSLMSSVCKIVSQRSRRRTGYTLFADASVEVWPSLLVLKTDLLWLLSGQLQAEARPKLGLCSRLCSVSA